MGKKIKKKKDGNSDKIGIQCRNARETKKWENFSLAHGCNKLNSILFSCIYAFCTKKKISAHSCFNERKMRKKTTVENVTKGRPVIFQIE